MIISVDVRTGPEPEKLVGTQNSYSRHAATLFGYVVSTQTENTQLEHSDRIFGIFKFTVLFATSVYQYIHFTKTVLEIRVFI